MIEPVDPFEHRELHRLEVAPRSVLASFVQPDNRFSQCVTVADAADRRCNTHFRQTLRIANGQVLRTAVAAMNQPLCGPTFR